MLAAPDIGFVPDTEAAPAQDIGFVPDQMPGIVNAPPQFQAVLGNSGLTTGQKAGVMIDAIPGARQALTAAEMGFQGLGSALGVAGGALTGPAAPAAIPAGGAAGAAATNYGVQKLEQWLGNQKQVKPGELAASSILGFVPGGSMVGQGIKGAVKQAAKTIAMTEGALTTETLIDEGKLPTWQQAMIAAGLGGLATALQGKIDTGKNMAPVNTAAAKMATRDTTLAEAKAAGYVVPPFETNSTGTTNALGSVGGKAATKQQATIQNQQITNALAAKSIGLNPNQPITMPAIEAVRNEAGKAYQAVASLSPDAAADLYALRKARSDAKAYFDQYAKQGGPEPLEAAKNAAALADKLETKIETHARAFDNWVDAGKPTGSAEADWFQAEKDMAKDPTPNGLVQALRDARTTIAKTHVVEGALNEANGEISAPVIGRLYDKGAPLTGELSTIGKFANAFKSYAGEASKTPAPGVSHVNALWSVLGAGAGAALGGEHSIMGGMVGTVAPSLARTGARNFQLSPMVQRGALSYLSKPNYGGALPDLPAVLARYYAMNDAMPQFQPAQKETK